MTYCSCLLDHVTWDAVTVGEIEQVEADTQVVEQVVVFGQPDVQ